MSQKELDKHELQAARAAIDVAGPYLDEIQVHDLSALDNEQMDYFLSLFIRAYEDGMKSQWDNNVPF